MLPQPIKRRANVSLSARRAWIEIQAILVKVVLLPVALRKESVDRNLITKTAVIIRIHVALRKESVDRNPTSYPINQRGFVALRKESVDRNLGLGNFMPVVISRSPQGERG